MTSRFNKLLAVMHISVRQDIIQVSFLEKAVSVFILDTFKCQCNSDFKPIVGGFSWITPSKWTLTFPRNKAKKTEFLIHSKKFRFTQKIVQLKILLRYIIVVSLINIAFAVVKLKVFKALRASSAYIKFSFLGDFRDSYFPVHSTVLPQSHQKQYSC